MTDPAAMTRPTRARRVVLMAAIVLMAGSVVARDRPPWPSPGQIALVKERRAAFPVATLVSAVEWYKPQESVAGVAHPGTLHLVPVSRRSIGPAAIADALAYATAQKSYALLVWRNGGLELEKYWGGFGPRSRFETASMHKTVVALALGVAVARGKIGSIDDPIARYIPALAGTPRGRQPLRAYLEMASGIETPSSTVDDSSPYWQYALGDDAREAAAHWPDSCAARTEFCYANANTLYLGWALSNAVGMRYADWLSQTLWRPMGASEARLWLDHPGGSPRYSAYLMATARDWLRVGRLLLDRGRANGRQLVPARWIAAMIRPSPANPHYGWQIWRGSPYAPARTYGPHIKAVVRAAAPFARDDVVFLDGSAGQRVYVIPSEKMVIVRIGAPSVDWDDSKLPNVLLAGIR